MNIIKKGVKVIYDLLSNLKYDKNKSYKKSRFFISFPFEDGIICFNTLTRMVLYLEQNEYEELNIFFNENKFGDVVDVLLKYWFIINEEIDEDKIFEQINEILKIQEDRLFNGYIDYTIFTTTVCNANCFYCFEKGTNIITMNQEVASQVVEYIDKTRKKGKKIFLTWFGGEPLCNSDIINFICSELENRNIEFCSRIITNGSILNNKILKIAISKWKLHDAQITLDGFEDEYNNIKKYNNPQRYNFDVVIQNIKELLSKDIILTIRLNCDNNNINSIKQLVEYLEDIKLEGKYFIDLQQIHNSGNNVCENEVTEHFYDVYLKLKIKIEYMNEVIANKYKFEVKDIFSKYKEGNCQSISTRIFADGKIFPCQHINDVNSIGDVWKGITDLNKDNIWKSGEFRESCKKCHYLPICGKLKYCPTYNLNCQSTIFNQIKSMIIKSIEDSKKDYKYNINGKYSIYPILDFFVAVNLEKDIYSENYIKMNTTGLFIWKNILQKKQKSKIIEKVIEEYKLDKNMANKIVNNFLEYLENEKIVYKYF